MPHYPEALPPERLRPFLEALIGGARVGDSVAGWTLVHIDTDEGLGYMFERENARIEYTLGPRDDRHPRFAESRSFNLSYYVARQPGRALPRDARELVSTITTRIRARDDGRAGLALRAPLAVTRSGDIRTTRVESLLAPVELDGARYYTANPYVGCLIGCAFCYAAPRIAMVRRLALLDDADWGRYVLAKINAPEVLADELARAPHLPVVLSPLVADVYQSVERSLELTRRCLEVLRAASVPTYVLTRASLVLRDKALLASMPNSTVGFSVSTDDDDVGRRFEPRAATIGARLDALLQLRRSGVRTVGVVQPILPMNPERLAQRLAEVCDLVRVDRFRAADAGAPTTVPRPVSGELSWDERDLHARVLAELERLRVPLFTSHVPLSSNVPATSPSYSAATSRTGTNSSQP